MFFECEWQNNQPLGDKWCGGWKRACATVSSRILLFHKHPQPIQQQHRIGSQRTVFQWSKLPHSKLLHASLAVGKWNALESSSFPNFFPTFPLFESYRDVILWIVDASRQDQSLRFGQDNILANILYNERYYHYSRKCLHLVSFATLTHL